MLVWMREKKRFVAKVFVYPLIFVFIALYGSSQVANQQALNAVTAVTVNGERIPYTEYQSVLKNVQQELSGSFIQPEKSQSQIALERLIQAELARQLGQDLKLASDDQEVNQVISSQFGSSGYLDPRIYQYFLAESGFGSHEAYQAFIRRQLDTNLALRYIQATGAPTPEELDRVLLRQTETRQAEMLVFDAAEYGGDDITPTTAEAEAFFQEHIERYRLPKRMKLQYVEARPEDLVGEATSEEERFQRWFRSRRENFLVPVQREILVQTFHPESFREQVKFTEEDLQAFYEERKASAYTEPEKFKVRFVSVPVGIPDVSVEAAIAANPEDFQAAAEAVAARHLLLRFPPGAGPETREEVVAQIAEIRTRISTEDDFIREAKAFSDDKSNSSSGGDLGFFERGRMVAPFEEVAFTIEPATCSEPVETRFGMHLIWVYDKRAEGDPLSLEEARRQLTGTIDTTPIKDAAREQLTALAVRAATYGLLSPTSAVDLEVHETDWFARGDSPHDLVGRNWYPFYQAVTQMATGELSQVVEDRERFFLLELVGKQAQVQKPLADIRAEVEDDYRQREAGNVARSAAREAMDKIRSGSLTFEALPDTYGLSQPESHTRIRRPSETQVEENLQLDRELINRTYLAMVGGVEGPIDTLQGNSVLIKVVEEEPEHLPELDEVRNEAEAEYKKSLATDLARDLAWDIWVGLDKHDGNLVAAAEAVENGRLEVKETEYFEPGRPIPGFPTGSILGYVAAGLRVEGATTTVLEDPPRTEENKDTPIEAFYLARVKEIQETHLPEFDEVSEEVFADLKRDLAAPLAKSEAEAVATAISDLLQAATGPVSASRSLDLQAFARDKEIVFKPAQTIQFGTEVPGLPGERATARVVATVYDLPLTAVSQPIPLVQHLPEGDALGSRIYGYVILQVIDSKENKERLPSRGEAYRAIADSYRRMLQEDWLQRALKTAKIEVNDRYFAEELIVALNTELGQN